MQTVTTPVRMDRRQAAEFLGISIATLSQDVVTKRHRIPVAKIGRKCVYDRALLEQWLLARTTNIPTVSV